MSEPLKSVAEHEAEANRPRNKYRGTPGYQSGVACPECGGELRYFIGGIEYHNKLAADPTKANAFCRACDHMMRLTRISKPEKIVPPVEYPPPHAKQPPPLWPGEPYRQGGPPRLLPVLILVTLAVLGAVLRLVTW